MNKSLKTTRGALCSLASVLSSGVLMVSNVSAATINYYSGTTTNDDDGTSVLTPTLQQCSGIGQWRRCDDNDAAYRGLYEADGAKGVLDDDSAIDVGVAAFENIITNGFKFNNWKTSYYGWSGTHMGWVNNGNKAPGDDFKSTSSNLLAVAQWTDLKKAVFVNSSTERMIAGTPLVIMDDETAIGGVTLNYKVNTTRDADGATKETPLAVTSIDEEFTFAPDEANGYELKKVEAKIGEAEAVDMTASVEDGVLLLEDVEADVDLDVEMGLKEFNVTATVNDEEHASISPIPKVEYGQSASFEVNLEEGYKVASVKGGTLGEDGVTITVADIKADTKIEVTVERIKNVVTASLDGEISHATLKAESDEVLYGDDVTFGLDTLDEGYYLAGVRVDGGNPGYSANENNEFTLEEVKGAHSVVFIIARYNVLTASVESGNGSITPSQTLVKSNESAEFTITPDEGYAISLLLVNGEIVKDFKGNTLALSDITEDYNVIVKFEQLIFTLDVQPADNVTVNPSGTTTVVYGATPLVYISANKGYEITEVLVNDEDKTASLKDNFITLEKVTKDTVVKVKVAAEQYEVLDGDDQHITVSTEKDLIVRFSGNCDLFTEADIDGEKIDEKYYTVTCGSTILTVDGNYIASLGAGSHTVSALYSNGTKVDAFFTLEEPAEPEKEPEEPVEPAKEPEVPKTPDTGVFQQIAENATPLTFAGIVVVASIAALLFVAKRKNA